MSTTTTTDSDSGDKPPGNELLVEEALAWLYEYGVPAWQAQAAVARARAGGWDARQINDCVAGWLDHAESDAGRGIRAPGFLAITRLRDCQPAPVTLRDGDPPGATIADLIAARRSDSDA